jgi:hypothetical protein
MSDIPEVRKIMEEILVRKTFDAITVAELHRGLRLTWRKHVKPKTAPRSQRLTPKLASEIRRYTRSHPKASAQYIANHFNVNPGRVTDALMGVK